MEHRSQHPQTQPDNAFASTQYVFLDRDGVINRKPPEGEYISDWSSFYLLPEAGPAIATLNASGRKVIVITNQRGVALGLYTEADVKRLHEELQHHLATYSAHVDAFYFCPHDRGECDCRKPGTGLFQRAFMDFPEATAANSVVIGDSLSDIEAARRLSFPSIFILGDPQLRKSGAEEAAVLADATAKSLARAVALYLS